MYDLTTLILIFFNQMSTFAISFQILRERWEHFDLVPGWCRKVAFSGSQYTPFLKTSFIRSNKKAKPALEMCYNPTLVTFPVLAVLCLSQPAPPPTAVIRLISWHGCDLILSAQVFHHFFTSISRQRFAGFVQQPQWHTWSVWYAFVFLLCPLASACFFVKSRFVGQSQRLDNRVGRTWNVCSALQNNGSVNKITESLNNASGRPIPSFEGKFGPITIAPWWLIF